MVQVVFTAASHIEQLSPGKLEIQKAQPEDGGMYRCLVKNKYGSETRYFQLNVTMGKQLTYLHAELNSDTTEL